MEDEIETGQQEIISDPPENETRAEVNAQIRSAVTYARLPAAFANDLIDREATVEEARSAVFAEMQRRSVPVSNIRVGPSGDDPAVVQDRMAEALACRAMGTEPSEGARAYMSLGMSDMARQSLQRSGQVGIATLGREEVLTRALHTTSDFPNLLTATGNRILMPAYRAAESQLKQLARQRTADDFRPMSLLKLGEFGKLQKVTEAGEIKALTTGEAKEGYSVETFGGMFNLSRKAIINDDLGAFARWAEMMGRAAGPACRPVDRQSRHGGRQRSVLRHPWQPVGDGRGSRRGITVGGPVGASPSDRLGRRVSDQRNAQIHPCRAGTGNDL